MVYLQKRQSINKEMIIAPKTFVLGFSTDKIVQFTVEKFCYLNPVKQYRHHNNLTNYIYKQLYVNKLYI